jgi:hypothetical protein
VENERVGRDRPLSLRQRRSELLLHHLRVVGFRKADPICDSQHVAIDRQRRDPQRVTQDDARSFPADSRKLDEILHSRRYLAPMLLDERGGHAHQRLRLHPKEAGGLDLRLELCRRRPGERRWIGVSSE